MISSVEKSTISPRRLHSLVILFSTLKIFRDMMIPLVVLLYSSLTKKNVDTTGVYWELAVLGGFILLFVIYGFIHWRTYTYRVEEGEFRVEKGVIKKEKSYISLQRIQSIDFTESIIHQIFGVVMVQIQTAGGAKPEVQLTAVLKSEAERLKKELLSKSHPSKEVMVQETKAEEAIVKERTITNGELMLAGLTSGKIGVILSGILALGSQLPNMLEDISFTSLLPEGIIGGDAVTILLFVGVGFAITWFLSVIYTIIMYGNFVIEKKEDRLFITYGLLERKHLSISLARVQAVKVVEGILRQPFGYVTLHLVSAGGMMDKKEKLDILFPLMKRKEVRGFLETFLPDYAVSLEVKPLPVRARSRFIFWNMFFVVPVIGTVCWFFPVWGLLSLFLLPVTGLLGALKYRDGGYSIKGNKVIFRSREIARTTAIVPLGRIQSNHLHRSYFQQRKKLVSYYVNVASTAFGERFGVRNLDERDGDMLFKKLSKRQ